MKIYYEETFGPVAPLISFNSEEEVIEMANSTKYGLSPSIFTENISKGHRVAAKTALRRIYELDKKNGW